MPLVLKEEDFYRKLAADELRNQTSKEAVKEDILIDDEALLNGEFRVIKNLVFESKVRFESIDIISGIAFIDCEFREGIIFNEITASKYDENFVKQNCNLFFSGCKISSLVIENNSSFYRGVHIFNETIIKKMFIVNSKIGNGGINIKASVIEEQLDLSGSHSDDIHIQHSTIKGTVRFESLTTNSCSFIKSTFDKWIQKWNCSFINLTFNDNTFEETIKITALKITNTVTFSGDEFKKEFIINFVEGIKVGELNQLYIKEAKFVSGLVIDGGNQNINLLTIPFTSKFEGVVKFINCSFSKTLISGINHNASLFFKSVKFRIMTISDFNNHNSLTFSNCEGLTNSILEIKDSDLGDTKFNDFSFKSFSEIKIDYSLLNNILTSNIEWFDDSQLRFESSNTSKALRNKREI